jgi:hypothetical protein
MARGHRPNLVGPLPPISSNFIGAYDLLCAGTYCIGMSLTAWTHTNFRGWGCGQEDEV